MRRVNLSPLFEPFSVTASAAWSLEPTSSVRAVTLESCMLSTVTESAPVPRLRPSAWIPVAVTLPLPESISTSRPAGL